jgi:uncharacterized protein (TIGR03085 family)
MLSSDDLRSIRRDERAELLNTLRAVGPAAPTLCNGWTAHDIAAHLAASEAQRGIPLAMAYRARRLLPPRPASALMRRLQALGERQNGRMHRRGWDDSLRRLEAGPPSAFEARTIAPIRFVEEWVHHEDVRRANGRGPRATNDDALWSCGQDLVRFISYLPGREVVEAVLDDGRRLRIGGEGADVRVTVAGRPGEVLLWLAGRTDAADVTVDGASADVARLVGRLDV